MSLPLQLDIEGMTCASCATRVEKALNKVEGVEASVNYATERATVVGGVASTEALLQAIEQAGYHAKVHEDASAEDGDPAISLRRRLLISAALTIPVVVLSMVPPIQFPYWQWLVTALAIPVTIWGHGPSTERPESTPDTALPPWTP